MSVIRDAYNAQHALRVHAMYAKHEAEKPASARGYKGDVRL